MTELILIRHGETDWNRQQRFQGQIDVPLNETGRQQAARLGARLADEPIDVLLASDLQRTQATAAELARQPLREVLAEPLWREQAFGVLEGLDLPTIRSRHAELWAQWKLHDADFALPGGESNRDFHARVLRALDALLARHRGRRVAVVTHGGVLDMLWRSVHGLPLHGARQCEIPNTGINRLRWSAGRLHIVSWGDAAHLDGLPAQPSMLQTVHGEPNAAGT